MNLEVSWLEVGVAHRSLDRASCCLSDSSILPFFPPKYSFAYPASSVLVLCSCIINSRHPSFIFSCIHLQCFEPQGRAAFQIRMKVTWYNLYLHLAAPHLFKFSCISSDHVKNNQSKRRVVSHFYAYAPTSGDLLKHRNHVRAYNTWLIPILLLLRILYINQIHKNESQHFVADRWISPTRKRTPQKPILNSFSSLPLFIPQEHSPFTWRPPILPESLSINSAPHCLG